MGTREDLEEGLGDGAVADRDDVNEQRERDADVQLPPETDPEE
jgi:hypothetical protein